MFKFQIKSAIINGAQWPKFQEIIIYKIIVIFLVKRNFVQENWSSGHTSSYYGIIRFHFHKSLHHCGSEQFQRQINN